MKRSSLLTILLVVLPLAAIAAVAKNNREPIHITSNRLTTDTKGNKAVFEGQVAARQGDVNLYSDRMVVHYDNVGKEVAKIECFGNVRIIQGDKRGFGGVGVYDNRAGTIVLTVNPKVYQGEDMVSGTEITYFIEDERSLVTSTPGTRVEAVLHPKAKDTKPKETPAGGK